MAFIIGASKSNKLLSLIVLNCLLIIQFPQVLKAQEPEVKSNASIKKSADTSLTEDDYYRLVTIPIPENINLEVGGLALLPNGDLAAATRRGEVWIIENPYFENGSMPYFRRYAYGLHEALGLVFHDQSLYTAQRGELTRLTDTDGDGKADNYKKIAALPVSGNYHEYSHGPVLLPDGNFWVNLNLAHNDHPFYGEMSSLAKWRGWAVKVTPDGKLIPFATGLRSPAGLGLNNEGDMFYAENQGGWMASGFIAHVEEGNFFGHPGGLIWSELPESNVKLKPQDIPNTDRPYPLSTNTIPGFKVPAVWLPHGIMGNSTSEILADNTNGRFGPFGGQLFVGDQAHSKVNRIFLEKVKGKYQGACFPFKQGFASGVLRMEWGNDGSLFAGLTDRGWTSTGPKRYGVQRLIWSGNVPFEMKTIKAQPDGFEIEFTASVDKNIATNISSYKITGFTYKYHMNYGSPVVEMQSCSIKGVVVSEDGTKARLVVDSLREGYIHEIKAEGIRNTGGARLLHNYGYYTLNNIPDGAKLDIKTNPLLKASTKKSEGKTTFLEKKATPPATKASIVKTKRQIKMPVDWKEGPDKSIVVATRPGLQFDITQIEVKAGSKVKITFNDNDDMQHNLVILEPNAIEEVGEASLNLGLEGASINYVPKSGKVLYHTKLLSPGGSDTIYFIAPDKPGSYPYICTYPGHYTVMQGVLKVLAK